MTTLVWLFTAMTAVISAFVTHKLTAWYYKRKIKHIKNARTYYDPESFYH